MLNPYHDALDIKHILDLQNVQYQNALYLEEEVPATSQRDAAVQISSLGHFMLLSMTGAFSTMYLDDQTPADDGRCQVFIQLLDGSNQRPLFEDFVWAGLFLSPGRFKALPGAVGAQSDQLYLEYPFIYTFPNNGQITVKIRNESDKHNIVRIMFKGIRIFPKQRNQQ